MKRFVLFAGQRYYAGGGALDFKGEFDELGMALEVAATVVPDEDDWFHIVDADSWKVVAFFGYAHGAGNDIDPAAVEYTLSKDCKLIPRCI